MTDEITPITAEAARQALETAIVAHLGENWDDELDGWAVISRHDYMARLNKGRTNLDFYVDILGNVTVEEKEINAGQENGRYIAAAMLGGSLMIAFILARIAGYL